MPRKQVFTGLYACPICEDEYELYRASGAELLCPTCRENLEPVLHEEYEASKESRGEMDFD